MLVNVYFSISNSVQNSDNNEEEEGGDNSGGMNSYLKEVFSIIPHDEILMMFFTKMETSNAFSSLLEKFHEEDFENLNENLRVNLKFLNNLIFNK